MPYSGAFPAPKPINDFNGDGHADTIQISFNPGFIVTNLANGDGTFTTVRQAVSGMPGDPVTADFSHDGRTDFAYSGRSFVSNGDGTFTETGGSIGPPVGRGEIPPPAVFGDFNGDGNLDVATTGASGWYMNEWVSISFGNGWSFGGVQIVLAQRASIVAGDLTGDGKADLVVRTQTSTTYLMVSNGDGTFSPTVPPGFPTDVAAFDIADVDSDGRLDLIGPADGGPVLFYRNSGCNATPAITGEAVGVRLRGSAYGTIATLSDSDDPVGTLAVSVAYAQPGLTVEDLANMNGTIRATVSASCLAETGLNTVVLRVQDGAGAKATTTVRVTVVGQPPTLGTYPAGNVIRGGSITVSPSGPPTDDLAVAALVASGPPGFTGTFEANPDTGAVTVANAGPVGNYTITVTASDDCAQTTTSFPLTVYAAPTVTTGAASSINDTTAILNGTVNANNGSAVTAFEYGFSTSYGSVAVAQTVSGMATTAISTALSGIRCGGIVYHYRARATNDGGISYGDGATFITPICPDTLTVGTVTSGATVSIYLRDSGGSRLGADSPAKIQVLSVRVSWSPAGAIESARISRAGITTNLTPNFESSTSGSGYISWVTGFTTPVPTTVDADAPGEQVAAIEFVVSAGAIRNSNVTLTIDPSATATSLSDQSGLISETTTNAELKLVNGSLLVPSAVPGDANGDGLAAVSDVFYLINHLLAGGPAPTAKGDVNGDLLITMADVSYLRRHFMAGGPPPL